MAPREDQEQVARRARAHLQEILSSDTFRGATRHSDLLGYLVNETLDGRNHRVTGTSIMIDVFGKSPQEAAEEAALARVQVGQLRMRLSNYYDQHGARSGLRIRIPKGRYQLVFEEVGVETAEDAVTPRNDLLVAVGPFEAPATTDRYKGYLERLTSDLDTMLLGFRRLTLVQPPDDSRNDGARSILGPLLRVKGKVVRRSGADWLQVYAVFGELESTIWFYQMPLPTDAGLLQEQGEQIAQKVAGTFASLSGPVMSQLPELWTSQGADNEPGLLFLVRVFRYRFHLDRETFLVLRDELETAAQNTPVGRNVRLSMAWLYLDAARFRFQVEMPRADLIDLALHEATIAVEQAQTDAHGWYVLAMIHFLRSETLKSELERAKSCASNALRLNPIDADALADIGHQLWLFGDIEEGRRFVQRALELNLEPPGWYWFCNVHELMRTHDFPGAKKALAKMEMPDFFWTHLLNLAIAGHLEDRSAALHAFAKLKSESGWVIERYHIFLSEGTFPDMFKSAIMDGLQRAEELVASNP